ncbi:MAG TPA: hypothetical protein V6C85_02505 [Allocoleopsis sp.]
MLTAPQPFPHPSAAPSDKAPPPPLLPTLFAPQLQNHCDAPPQPAVAAPSCPSPQTHTNFHCTDLLKSLPLTSPSPHPSKARQLPIPIPQASPPPTTASQPQLPANSPNTRNTSPPTGDRPCYGKLKGLHLRETQADSRE